MRLILGDGILATELIGQTGWAYISRSKDGLDINRPETLRELVPRQTSTIINLIANTDTYSTDIKGMFDTNYRAVKGLVEFCNQRQIKLVHYSTDYVYENSRSNATEQDEVGPTTPYAMSKALADEYIQQHCRDYLICRGSHKPTPFQYDIAWQDVRGNFDYIDVITEIFHRLIMEGAQGLFNIGTPTKTMYELAAETNQRVKPALAPPHFPKDVTMDLSKLNNFLQHGKETT